MTQYTKGKRIYTIMLMRDGIYYGAPEKYMADESDIRDSVTECGCQNPQVIEKYKKHFSEE